MVPYEAQPLIAYVAPCCEQSFAASALAAAVRCGRGRGILDCTSIYSFQGYVQQNLGRLDYPGLPEESETQASVEKAPTEAGPHSHDKMYGDRLIGTTNRSLQRGCHMRKIDDLDAGRSRGRVRVCCSEFPSRGSCRFHWLKLRLQHWRGNRDTIISHKRCS